MTVKHVWLAFVLGAVVAACTKDTGGTVTNPVPVAGLRYFNAVGDTGAVDFRVVDIVGYAPNQVSAAFRSGGNVQGIAAPGTPPHQAVQAGMREIRVFLSGTDVQTTSTLLLDTTYNFVAGTNYTFYLYGYARTGQTPKINALIAVDSVPVPPTGNLAVRVLNLAGDTTGLGASVDAFVLPQANAPAGSPPIAGQAFLGMSNYINVPVGSLKTVVTRGGTLTAAATANLPAGVVGTGANCPFSERIAGSLVAGTGVTAVVLPRSVAGSAAAAFARAGIVYMIDLQPPLICP
jgi:hypothetical protein